jgi:hypothetical protein
MTRRLFPVALFVALGLTLTGCYGERYPTQSEGAFLGACEMRGSAAGCQCALNWFEDNVSFSQFLADDAEARMGVVVPDMYSAASACT